MTKKNLEPTKEALIMLDTRSTIPVIQQSRIELAVAALSAALRPNQKSYGFVFQCVIDSVEGKENGRVEWLKKQNGRYGTGLKVVVEWERKAFLAYDEPTVEIVTTATKPQSKAELKIVKPAAEPAPLKTASMKLNQLKELAASYGLNVKGDKRKRQTWEDAINEYLESSVSVAA